MLGVIKKKLVCSSNNKMAAVLIIALRQGGSESPFKLIIFIAWLGMHV